ncbi:MAG TPA: family 1 encapsulin nanocompartment shell protein, partial [Acidimicrobiia bacterium]
MTDHLLRSQAPISDAAWSAIDEEARSRLAAQLAARKLVDFVGPSGWEYSATPLGRTIDVDSPFDAVVARQRTVLPVVELRAEFTLSRRELDAVDRGASDPDLTALDDTAREFALAENHAVFEGFAAAGIVGLTESSTHDVIQLDGGADTYPASVAKAVDSLRKAGIGGPFGIAIAPDIFTHIVETTEHGGYPLFNHLESILGGPVVWAPGVGCGAVLSLRGGDFRFE